RGAYAAEPDELVVASAVDALGVARGRAQDALLVRPRAAADAANLGGGIGHDVRRLLVAHRVDVDLLVGPARVALGGVEVEHVLADVARDVPERARGQIEARAQAAGCAERVRVGVRRERYGAAEVRARLGAAKTRAPGEDAHPRAGEDRVVARWLV